MMCQTFSGMINLGCLSRFMGVLPGRISEEEGPFPRVCPQNLLVTAQTEAML